MKFLADVFGFLGEFIANTTSGACLWGYFDEEEMPEELL